jgi:hypothetical protein
MTEIMLATTEGYQGFWAEPSLMLWSAVLRMTEALISASPFLVTGLLISGILRGMVGTDGIRRMFGVGHWSGPIRGWFLGILLPICSLGALPVARELRRAGVPSGTVLSFVLVAPVLNPISILYGISHIALITLVYFFVGTMIVSLGIGFIWDYLVSKRRDAIPPNAEQLPAAAYARLAISGITSTRGMLGSLADVGMAVLAVGLLGALLPYGTLQFSMTRDNAFATIIMGAVAIPAYVTPFEVMVQYGMIVRDGYSLGAAFALIVLGAGANVGVANWIRREYGYPALATFVILLLSVTLLLGVTADRAIHHGKAAVDHTHAFDSYTRLSRIEPDDTYFTWFAHAIKEELTRSKVVGAGLFGVMLCAAISLHLLGERATVQSFLRDTGRRQATPAEGVFNRPVSMRVIIASSVFGLCASIGVAIYIVYPPPHQLAAEADVVSVWLYDAVRDENHDEINRRVEQWETAIKKIPIAAYIRGMPLTPETAQEVGDVAHLLEVLRHYNEHGEYPQAATLVLFLDKQHRACLDVLHFE